MVRVLLPVVRGVCLVEGVEVWGQVLILVQVAMVV
jgi:hypothetical protein